MVGDVLLPVQRQKKVKKSDYKNEGMIPVIDQSVDFIAGYTNVDDCKYKGELPVIIFGDHTRILKYVRFPFAAGADGTQVLKPSTEFDERYFYYCLIALNLKNYGYERHFKYLKEEEIIWRPLPLQRKIAGVLSAYDDLIENNSRRIKILEEMAQAIYQEWFVKFRFPGHEKVRMVDSPLGKIPEGWEIKSFSSMFDVKYGKNLPLKKVKKSGLYPVYGAGGIIGYYDELVEDEKIALVTCRGNGSGTVWRTRHPAFITNNSFRIKPKEEFSYMSYFFVEQLLKHSDIARALSGSAQPQITIEGISYVPVILADAEIIQNFILMVQKLPELIDKLYIKNQVLRETRDLLLPKLISGKIDVEGLDIDVGELAE